MTNDNTKNAPQDAKLISLSEDCDMAYWTNKFGVSGDRLVEAVRRVGHSAAAIKQFLRHPHSDARYQILPPEEMGFAVEVTIPGMNPTRVTGFATKQQARSWIAEHRRRVASGSESLRHRRPSSATNDRRNTAAGDDAEKI